MVAFVTDGRPRCGKRSSDMALDLESLRCFEEAARHLNFRRAAQSVHLSATAFGERIRRLEEALECVLFERSTRQVVLTAAGHRLLPQARRCLEEADRCRAVVSASQGPLPYALTIGTRFELGLSWLLPALDRLRENRPERTIHLSFGQGEDLFARAGHGQIDALVSSARFASSALAYAPIHEETYAFVCASARLAERPFTRPAHAKDHVLLDLDPALPLFRYLLDASGEMFEFGGREYLGTIAAVRARALAGAGVAVLPTYFVEPHLQSQQLKRVLPKISLTRDFFRLIWRTDHPRTSELLELAEELRAIPLA